VRITYIRPNGFLRIIIIIIIVSNFWANGIVTEWTKDVYVHNLYILYYHYAVMEKFKIINELVKIEKKNHINGRGR